MVYHDAVPKGESLQKEKSWVCFSLDVWEFVQQDLPSLQEEPRAPRTAGQPCPCDLGPEGTILAIAFILHQRQEGIWRNTVFLSFCTKEQGASSSFV